MSTKTDTALTALRVLAEPHRFGHACTDGWNNPGIPGRGPCPVLQIIDTVAETMTDQASAVHVAAHDDETMTRVATAMLAGSPLEDLDPEQAEGWIHLARLATEALAHELDRDPEREARVTAVIARLSQP